MPRLIPIVVLALAFQATSPGIGGAQARPAIQLDLGRSLDDLKPGARLRIALAADPSAHLKGRLEGFGETSMIVEIDGTRRDLPISSILVVDESYRDRKRGAIVGVLAAIVGVYAWDYFGPHPRYKDQDKRYRENVEALAVSVGAGVLIGGGIGWHRWRPVNTSAR